MKNRLGVVLLGLSLSLSACGAASHQAGADVVPAQSVTTDLTGQSPLLRFGNGFVLYVVNKTKRTLYQETVKESCTIPPRNVNIRAGKRVHISALDQGGQLCLFARDSVTFYHYSDPLTPDLKQPLVALVYTFDGWTHTRTLSAKGTGGLCATIASGAMTIFRGKYPKEGCAKQLPQE
ncbi:MAG TPA: hypothetical protein VKR56_09850 [Candidatus Cybelea sp.]|nr:hypothetical protein [Candidatus Cybelea sp.]